MSNKVSKRVSNTVCPVEKGVPHCPYCEKDPDVDESFDHILQTLSNLVEPRGTGQRAVVQQRCLTDQEWSRLREIFKDVRTMADHIKDCHHQLESMEDDLDTDRDEVKELKKELQVSEGKLNRKREAKRKRQEEEKTQVKIRCKKSKSQ